MNHLHRRDFLARMTLATLKCTFQAIKETGNRGWLGNDGCQRDGLACGLTCWLLQRLDTIDSSLKELIYQLLDTGVF